MADVPERLFRDDAGAAIERAARLEQENQRLRAELDRLRRPDEAPTLRTRPDSRPHPNAVWALAVGTIFIGGFMAAAAHRAEAPSAPRFHPPPPPVLLGASVPAPTAAATTADADDCDTPYTYDAHSVKHYKMQCIHPERGGR